MPLSSPPTAATRARVASIRVARSEPRASEARKEAGCLRVAAPIFRLPLTLSPSALPAPARFIRSNPAPPPRPRRARALPRRGALRRSGTAAGILPAGRPPIGAAGSPGAPVMSLRSPRAAPRARAPQARAPQRVRGPVLNAHALPASGEVSGGGRQSPPPTGERWARVGFSSVSHAGAGLASVSPTCFPDAPSLRNFL